MQSPASHSQAILPVSSSAVIPQNSSASQPPPSPTTAARSPSQPSSHPSPPRQPTATPTSATIEPPMLRDSTLLNQNIVIDVYSEKDKGQHPPSPFFITLFIYLIITEDFDLLEMTSSPDKQETHASIDEKFQFKTPNFPKSSSTNEIQALKEEIEYLRHLNEENVAVGHKIKDQLKVPLFFSPLGSSLIYPYRKILKFKSS